MDNVGITMADGELEERLLVVLRWLICTNRVSTSGTTVLYKPRLWSHKVGTRVGTHVVSCYSLAGHGCSGRNPVYALLEIYICYDDSLDAFGAAAHQYGPSFASA